MLRKFDNFSSSGETSFLREHNLITEAMYVAPKRVSRAIYAWSSTAIMIQSHLIVNILDKKQSENLTLDPDLTLEVANKKICQHKDAQEQQQVPEGAVSNILKGQLTWKIDLCL